MKIEKLETIWFDAQPNTLWLRIHTDEGLIGLGETYYAPRAVSALIHDVLASLLIGRPAFDIESYLPDIIWMGGLTEARNIAVLADTHYLPLTTHDTVEPVALWAAAHLALHAPNTMIVETVRGYYLGWYNEVMTEPIRIRDGYLALDERPGLGTALREEVLRRPDVHVEVTTAANLVDLSKA